MSSFLTIYLQRLLWSWRPHFVTWLFHSSIFISSSLTLSLSLSLPLSFSLLLFLFFFTPITIAVVVDIVVVKTTQIRPGCDVQITRAKVSSSSKVAFKGIDFYFSRSTVVSSIFLKRSLRSVSSSKSWFVNQNEMNTELMTITMKS